MQIVLFDPKFRDSLLPLTFTKSVAKLRVGGFCIDQKWEKALGLLVKILTQDYLQCLYDSKNIEGNILYINAAVCPNEILAEELNSISFTKAIFSNDILIGFKSSENLSLEQIHNLTFDNKVQTKSDVSIIQNPWDLFKLAGKEIAEDISRFDLDKQSENKLSNQNTVFGNQLFAHPSAKAKGCIFNTESGPIYLGEDTEVMEGSIIRGPFFLSEHSAVKLGAKIYGPTVIGPHCKVGGEISNSVLQGYSNKGHDGFMGNSVLGEWCNLGADTNTSNLKNNYSKVSVYSYATKSMENTGEQFCGVIMGDHSKTGINTMLNTGSVVGVSSNIFGGDFPPKFIPSFYWGGKTGETFKLEKAFEVAEKMMARRNVSLTENDRQILSHIFHLEQQ